MFTVDGSSDERLLLTMYPAEFNSRQLPVYIVRE